MPAAHNKATIVSMAIVAIGISTLLHEGVGHGVVSWLRGGVPVELTSNHLSGLHEDRWIDAGGTLVNLAAGLVALIASYAAGARANLRYFLWLLAVHNLLSGAGYFLFSGCLGIGDWQEVIAGLPHYAELRVAMAITGLVLYVFFAWLLARAVWPFCPTRSSYNVVGRLPYVAACCFNCLAGAFDPLGMRLLWISTIPAVFGGSSGMLWLDNFLPRPLPTETLVIGRRPAWWVFAAIFGIAYIVVLGRGIEFRH
ncbi:MAG TPA: hypothetical protein VGI45_24030 [Terracidiphilus sp.]|jgi:hypothetical protein